MTTPISIQSPLQIRAAIASAARATGVDFDYLLATAQRESGLKSDVKATTSSATGLFQFIDQTWLSMVKTHGAKYGLEAEAEAIMQDEKGRYQVADPEARSAILALRKDPKTASLMAGEMTRDAAEILGRKLGRAVTKGELYMAHFLGPSGAARFIAAKEANPEGRAAESFTREASANRSVFFEPSGAMRSMADVYNHLTGLHGQSGSSAPATPAQSIPATQPRSLPVEPAAEFHRSEGSPYPATRVAQVSGLGGYTSRLTPEVLMILSSLDLPFTK